MGTRKNWNWQKNLTDEELVKVFEESVKEVSEGKPMLKYNICKEEILRRMGTLTENY